MKIANVLLVVMIGVFALLVASCENGDVSYPDYEGGTTVYFAYQYPVRTIVLGEDTYDTSLDNQHRCEIYATMGGVYSNTKKITIDFVVDNTLCDNLFFENESNVTVMPTNYYTLDGSQIVLNKELQGAVGVQLKDAFFADSKALEKTYVIPLRMTNVQNADSILSGRQLITGAPRQYADGWDVLPKDYVLYCLKFINPWHATYLRRGIDQITENGVTVTKVRHEESVEKDEICSMKTVGLKVTKYPVSISIDGVNNEGGATITTSTCDLLLSFNDNNECTITSGTTGYSASGSGKFVEKGEKNSWGNKDRNVMYLEYSIDFGAMQCTAKDTLVVQSRGIIKEEFTPSYVMN